MSIITSKTWGAVDRNVIFTDDANENCTELPTYTHIRNNTSIYNNIKWNLEHYTVK